jgi:hypothetical protein
MAILAFVLVIEDHQLRSVRAIPAPHYHVAIPIEFRTEFVWLYRSETLILDPDAGVTNPVYR